MVWGIDHEHHVPEERGARASNQSTDDHPEAEHAEDRGRRGAGGHDPGVGWTRILDQRILFRPGGTRHPPSALPDRADQPGHVARKRGPAHPAVHAIALVMGKGAAALRAADIPLLFAQTLFHGQC